MGVRETAPSERVALGPRAIDLHPGGTSGLLPRAGGWGCLGDWGEGRGRRPGAPVVGM